ncbi:MAG: glycosyltransferase [Flavobacteriales bacterium]|nr:glycosyltransferase [Flavobacteriales bacterium]
MKIIIVGPAHPFRGGIAMFNEQLATAFQTQGAQVEIVTFTLQYPSFLFPGKTQFSEENPPNNLTVTAAINSINPLNWIKVGKILKNKQADLLIFSYWMPFMSPCFSTISYFTKKNKCTTTIGLIHNIIPHEKRFGDKKLSSLFVNQMDGFVTMSQSVADDLSTFTQKPIILTPHPLYNNFGNGKSKREARKNLGLLDSDKILLFFGIIRKYKGLDILLKAIANNHVKKLDVKLIVAGEFYEDEAEYRKIIHENSLETQVILVNSFIPNNQVSNYFCAADLVVLPYRNATQSGVTQIAYHFEKPMLITNVGGLQEIVTNKFSGLVVNPNPTEITDSIVDFYEFNLEQKLIQGVKTEKQKYSWETMVDKFQQLFNKINEVQ